MKKTICRIFLLLIFIANLPLSSAKSNVTESPKWQSDGKYETCDFWQTPANIDTNHLAACLENGLCAGEIFAVYTLLAYEHIICPPTDVFPASVSLSLTKFIKDNPKYSATHSLLETTVVAFQTTTICQDGFDLNKIK